MRLFIESPVSRLISSKLEALAAFILNNSFFILNPIRLNSDTTDSIIAKIKNPIRVDVHATTR